MIKELETCRICQQPIATLAHFYREHQLKLEDYCLKHFDRRDLLDNTPIPFKSADQYFTVSFSNKNNLKKYLKGLPRDLAANFCKKMLMDRKIEKGLVYSPLQIELLSLPCFPPVHYLLTLFDYYEYCSEIGLINKVNHHKNFNLQLNSIGDNVIIIDSRESHPLKFDIEYKVDKLNFADYHFTGNPNLYFERKSLPDFISTLSGGLERFTRELERANESGAYLVMIIENSIQEALTFNHLPWMKRVKTKATPEFIFYNLKALIQKFPKFQPLFVSGRQQVVEYMMKGFLSGVTFSQYDLQLLYTLKSI